MEKIKTDFNEDLDYRRKKTINPKKREAMLNWETDFFLEFCRKHISEHEIVTEENYSQILEELLNKYIQKIKILEVKSFVDYYGIFQALLDYLMENEELDNFIQEDENYEILFKTLIKIHLNEKEFTFQYLKKFQSKEEEVVEDFETSFFRTTSFNLV